MLLWQKQCYLSLTKDIFMHAITYIYVYIKRYEKVHLREREKKKQQLVLVKCSVKLKMEVTQIIHKYIINSCNY